MPEPLDLLAPAIAMGVAGSALMDLWSAVLRRRFGIPTLDYRLLGRWIGHLAKGRFAHQRIAVAEPVPRRARPGLGRPLCDRGDVRARTGGPRRPRRGSTRRRSGRPWPSASARSSAPWFVMQPAMGAGIAGSRTPNPTATRLRNLGTHVVYGLGLYAAAAVMAVAIR